MSESNQKWWAALGIGMGAFILALDWSIVNTALPAIQRDLLASLGELQWIMNLMGLVMLSLLVAMGRFSDAYGRKKLFLIGLVVFTVASAFAGFALNPIWLIICRGFQGGAIAILLPGSQALISHAFPENERGRAIGIWMTVVGLGLGLGPALGGIITSYSWRYIFFINIPFAIASFIIIVKVVEESKHSVEQLKMDWWGLIALVIALACLVFAIVEGPEIGWGNPWTIALFIIAGFLLAAFVVIEQKVSFPVINFSLFNNRRFLAGSIANLCCIGFIWGNFFLLCLYLQNLRGFPPLAAGFILLSLSVPFVIVSSSISRWQKVVKPKGFILTGFFILLISASMQIFFTSLTPVSSIIIALLLFGIGWGIMFGPATTAALDSIPRDLAGVASGGLLTIQEMGGVLGLAIAGSIFRNIEHNKIDLLLETAKMQISSANLTILKSKASNFTEFKAFATKLGVEEKVFSFFKTAFADGFQTALWFPFALSTFGFVFVLLVMPKKEKTELG